MLSYIKKNIVYIFLKPTNTSVQANIQHRLRSPAFKAVTSLRVKIKTQTETFCTEHSATTSSDCVHALPENVYSSSKFNAKTMFLHDIHHNITFVRATCIKIPT